MRPLPVVIALAGVVLLPQLAAAQAVDDPFSDYLQRSQGIALGAGDANAANEAIQTITPWPPYVADRRIPLEGRQATDSIDRMYRIPDPFEQQGAGASGPGGAPSPGGTGASSMGSPATPMQPASNGY